VELVAVVAAIQLAANALIPPLATQTTETAALPLLLSMVAAKRSRLEPVKIEVTYVWWELATLLLAYAHTCLNVLPAMLARMFLALMELV